MAHEIEILPSGNAAFVTARVPAWHGLGTVTTDAMTAADALAKAKLTGWNLRKRPAFSFDDVTGVEVENAREVHVIRTHPETGKPDILGTVGQGYRLYQNEEMADTLQAVTELSGAVYETAGSLKGGRRVFVALRLPEGFTVAGKDTERHEVYLVATTAHDGTAAIEIMATPVRVVCQNTLTWAAERANARWKAHHTAGANLSETVIREKLDLQMTALESFQTEAEQLLNTPLTNAEFDELITGVWGAIGDSDRAKKNAQRRRNMLFGLFEDAPTQKGINGTAWGGLQAVSEYVDHYERPTGKTHLRRESAVIGTGADRKGTAYRLLRRR